MWLIRCDVRIRTAWLGGSAVCSRPAHHRRNGQQHPAGNRLRGETSLLDESQEVLGRVVEFTEPAAMVQRVCDLPTQMIALQKQITDLQSQQLLPPRCDHLTFEQQLEPLRQKLEEARRTPRTGSTDNELWQELDDMTRDTRQSGEKVRALRTHFVNALSLAAWLALSPPQWPEDRGQKFPDSPDFSGSYQSQLSPWIVQLRMGIPAKAASHPNEQSTMRYACNRLRGVALGQILPHVWEDGTIGLEDLSAFIQLLEAAFGDLDRVATAATEIREINQSTASSLSIKRSSEVMQWIWIGIFRPSEMLYEWGCPKEWGTPLRTVICRQSFQPGYRCVRSGIIRYDDDRPRRGHRIREEWPVSPLPPDPQLAQRKPQEPPLERWPEIWDQCTWTSAQARGGFPSMKWRQGPRIGGVHTVVGLITGWQNVRWGRWLSHLRLLERK